LNHSENNSLVGFRAVALAEIFRRFGTSASVRNDRTKVKLIVHMDIDPSSISKNVKVAGTAGPSPVPSIEVTGNGGYGGRKTHHLAFPRFQRFA
jgi:hypothetical protein